MSYATRYRPAPAPWEDSGGAGALRMQARLKEGATSVSHQYRCSACAITYDVPTGAKAECPMCALEKQAKGLKVELDKALETIRGMEVRLGALGAQVDQVAAMRDAVAVIGQEDLVWLKAVLYRYREDRSIYLLAVSEQGTRAARGPFQRNTFALVVGRGRDNETCRMVSAGGVAILGYYDGLTREVGTNQAMSYLLRALSPALVPGEGRAS